MTVLVKPPKGHWKGDKVRDPLLRRLFLEPFSIEKNTVKHRYLLFYSVIRPISIKQFFEFDKKSDRPISCNGSNIEH